MRGGENQRLSMWQMNRRYPDRPLAQPTRRPVRNRRSGHPTERWFLKEHEQGRNGYEKYTENGR